MKNPLSPINYTQFIIGIVLILLGALVDRNTCAPAIEDEEMEGGCYYMFNHYGEGDRILTNEPCLNCTCHNSMLMCYLRVCPFTKPIGQDCTIEKKPDQCCPVITCPEVPVSLVTPGALISSTTTSTTTLATISPSEVATLERGCEMDGKYYPDGAQVAGDPSKPCELCYCIRNKTACVMQECTLNVDGCSPVFQPGVCCPVRYQCDGPLQITDASTIAGIITTTVSTLFSSTPQPGGCYRGGDYYADGSQIPTPGEAAPCEHCYCMHGEIVCAVQECGSPLENEGGNCTAVPPRSGLCCPEKYTCMSDDSENIWSDGVTNPIETSTSAGSHENGSEATQGPNDVSVTVSLESEVKPQYVETTTFQAQPGDSLSMETTSIKSVNITEEKDQSSQQPTAPSSTGRPDLESNQQQEPDEVSHDGTPSSNEPPVTNQESVTETASQSFPHDLATSSEPAPPASSVSASHSTDSSIESGSTESIFEASTVRDTSSPELSSSSPSSIHTSTAAGQLSSSAASESNEDETTNSPTSTGENEQIAVNDGTSSPIGGEQITTSSGLATGDLSSTSASPHSPSSDNLASSTSPRPQEGGITDSDVSSGINADDTEDTQKQTTLPSNIEAQTSTEKESRPQIVTSRPQSSADENVVDSEGAGASSDAVQDAAMGDKDSQGGTTLRPGSVGITGAPGQIEEDSVNVPEKDTGIAKPVDSEQPPAFDENSSQTSSGEEVTTIKVAAMVDEAQSGTKIKPVPEVSDGGAQTSTSGPSQEGSSSTFRPVPGVSSPSGQEESSIGSTQRPTTGDKDETQVSSESGQIIGEEVASASPPVINNLEGSKQTTPVSVDGTKDAVSPDSGSDKVSSDPAATSPEDGSDNAPSGVNPGAGIQEGTNEAANPDVGGDKIMSDPTAVSPVAGSSNTPSSSDSNNQEDIKEGASPDDGVSSDPAVISPVDGSENAPSGVDTNTIPPHSSSVAPSGVDSTTLPSHSNADAPSEESKTVSTSTVDKIEVTTHQTVQNIPSDTSGVAQEDDAGVAATQLPTSDDANNVVEDSQQSNDGVPVPISTSTVASHVSSDGESDSIPQTTSSSKDQGAMHDGADSASQDAEKPTSVSSVSESVTESSQPGIIGSESDKPSDSSSNDDPIGSFPTVAPVFEGRPSTSTGTSAGIATESGHTTLPPQETSINEISPGSAGQQTDNNDNNIEDSPEVPSADDNIRPTTNAPGSSSDTGIVDEDRIKITTMSPSQEDNLSNQGTVNADDKNKMTTLPPSQEGILSNQGAVHDAASPTTGNPNVDQTSDTSVEPAMDGVSSGLHVDMSTVHSLPAHVDSTTVSTPGATNIDTSSPESVKIRETTLAPMTDDSDGISDDNGVTTANPANIPQSQVTGSNQEDESGVHHDDVSTQSSSSSKHPDISTESPIVTEQSSIANDGAAAVTVREPVGGSATESNSVTESVVSDDVIPSREPIAESVTEATSAQHQASTSSSLEQTKIKEPVVESVTDSQNNTEDSPSMDENEGTKRPGFDGVTDAVVVTESSPSMDGESASHQPAAGTDSESQSPSATEPSHVGGINIISKEPISESSTEQAPSHDGISSEPTSEGVTEQGSSNVSEKDKEMSPESPAATEPSSAMHDGISPNEQESDAGSVTQINSVTETSVNDGAVSDGKESGLGTQSSIVTESSSGVSDAAGVTNNVSGHGTQSSIVTESSSALNDASGVTENVSESGSATQSNIVTESSSAIHDAPGVTENVAGSGTQSSVVPESSHKITEHPAVSESGTQSSVVTESSSAQHDAAGVTDNASGAQSGDVTESSSAMHDGPGETDNASATQSSVVTESSQKISEAPGSTDNVPVSESGTQSSVVTESSSAQHDGTGVTDNVPISGSGVGTESSSVVSDGPGVTDSAPVSESGTQSSVVTESSSPLHDGPGVTDNAPVSGSGAQSGVVTESSSMASDGQGITDNAIVSGTGTQSSVVTESSSAQHDSPGVTDNGQVAGSGVVTESSSVISDAPGVTDNVPASGHGTQSSVVTESSSALNDGQGVTDNASISGSGTQSGVVTESSSALHDGAGVTDNVPVSGSPTESNIISDPSSVSHEGTGVGESGSVTETNTVTESALHDGSVDNQKESQSSTESSGITESSPTHDGSGTDVKETVPGSTESQSVSEGISSTTQKELISASPTSESSITESSGIMSDDEKDSTVSPPQSVTSAASISPEGVSSSDKEPSTETISATDSSALNDGNNVGQTGPASHSSTESSIATDSSIIMDDPDRVSETVRPSRIPVTTQSSASGDTTDMVSDGKPSEHSTNAPSSDNVSGIQNQPTTILPGGVTDDKGVDASSPSSAASDSDAHPVADGTEDHYPTTTATSVSHSSPSSGLPEEITESNLIVNEMRPMESQSLVKENQTETHRPTSVSPMPVHVGSSTVTGIDSASVSEISSTTAQSIDKDFNAANDSPVDGDRNTGYTSTPRSTTTQSATESAESATVMGDKGQSHLTPADSSSETPVNDENATPGTVISENQQPGESTSTSSTQSSNIDISTAKETMIPEVTSASPSSIPSENISESNDEPSLITTAKPDSSTSSAEDDTTPVQDSVEDTSVSNTITRIPGEGSCFVEGKTYRNGTRIPPSTPCQLACACQNSIVHCLLVHCPPAPNNFVDCKPMYRSGICCPEYDCGSTSSPPSITVTPDSGDSSSGDTLVTITPEPFSPETTSASKETSSATTTISSSSGADSEKDTEIHDDDSHKDSVGETNSPISVTIEAIFTSTPSTGITGENLVVGSTERIPQSSEQPNPTQGDNQMSMETTSDNILELGTGAVSQKPVTPAEQESETSSEQTSTSSSSSVSSVVSSESSTKPEINEVSPEVSESPEESPSFDPSVESDRRNDTETLPPTQDNNIPDNSVDSQSSTTISTEDSSSSTASASINASTTTTEASSSITSAIANASTPTTEASSSTITTLLPSSTGVSESDESSEGSQPVDTASESSSSSTTTAGSKYPVTTTTSVTPSAAPWPYPTSTQSTVMSSGACLFDGRVYMSAQQIPRDDPCDFCFCFRGDIICLQQSCPPPIPGCYEEPIPGFCCPRYECPVGSGNITTQPPLFPPSYYHNQILNNVAQASGNPVQSGSNIATGPGCEISGEYFETGQVITSTSGPCLECRCGSTGMMECDPRECQPEPMLRKMIAAITSR